MKREIEKKLIDWKNDPLRVPLIIRGARQVGKSFSVENFGRDNFDHLLVINFEERKEAASCFESLEIDTILKRINFLYGENLEPGKSLLFLDEIQLCPKAIKSLRYFKEKRPDLHVIAAGSLLEFVLEDEHEPISFPVGRVEFLNMKPLSFLEFLNAIEEGSWVEAIETNSFNNLLPEDFHNKLLGFVKEYFIVGGMPAAVNAFKIEKTYQKSQRIKSSLLDLYRLDLAKYGQKKEFPHLQKLFNRSPHLVCQHFRYSKIDPESQNPSREYKISLHKLIQAGLITSIHSTSANGLPFEAEINEKKFKIIFLDIGLLQCSLGVDPNSFISNPLIQIHHGILAEQFVGQELLCYQDPYLERHLYFWEREKLGSSAEIDFLTDISGKIIPIEVKSGGTGRLRSLRQFMELKSINIGVKISSDQLSWENNVLSLPFYMISQLERLITELQL